MEEVATCFNCGEELEYEGEQCYSCGWCEQCGGEDDHHYPECQDNGVW